MRAEWHRNCVREAASCYTNAVVVTGLCGGRGTVALAEANPRRAHPSSVSFR
jgi:hypothetical protein